MKTYGIVVAGGRGRRVGEDKNKCFLSLCKKPVILWTLEALYESEVLSSVVCVVGEEAEKEELGSLLQGTVLEQFVFSIMKTPGPHRQDGVSGGVLKLFELSPKRDDLVLVHNGANPLVGASDIKDCILAAKETGASVCAHPVKDTIRQVQENKLIKKTLSREQLFSMQTPQVIRYELFCEALKRAKEDRFYGTDDVELLQRIGQAVKVVECHPTNFKITTAYDLAVAEQILKNKTPSSPHARVE